MINFWKILLSILLFSLGAIMITHNRNKIRKKGRDPYGGDYQIIGGAIMLLLMGLITFIKELMKF